MKVAQLKRQTKFSDSTLYSAFGGKQLPSQQVTLAIVEACGGDLAEWRSYWSDVRRSLDRDAPDGPQRAVIPPWAAPAGSVGDAGEHGGLVSVVDDPAATIEAQPWSRPPHVKQPTGWPQTAQANLARRHSSCGDGCRHIGYCHRVGDQPRKIHCRPWRILPPALGSRDRPEQGCDRTVKPAGRFGAGLFIHGTGSPVSTAGLRGHGHRYVERCRSGGHVLGSGR